MTKVAQMDMLERPCVIYETSFNITPFMLFSVTYYLELHNAITVY